MRTVVLLAAVCGAALMSSAASAQTSEAQPSVDSYLCAFAGKCGEEAGAEPEVTRAAPATKGFSLARPGQTRDAPATKGFSLAKPQTQNAPATKGFSLAKPQEQAAAERASSSTRGFSLAQPTRARANTAAAPANTPRRAATTRPRNAVAAAAPVSVGSGIRRKADLMVSFELNSDKLTPAGEARAKIFAESMLRPELVDKRFMIAGHTDSVGNRAANIDLSRRRAQAVADYLSAAGVSANRLEVKGFGPAAPIAGRKAADPANRRVEAELIS